MVLQQGFIFHIQRYGNCNYSKRWTFQLLATLTFKRVIFVYSNIFTKFSKKRKQVVLRAFSRSVVRKCSAKKLFLHITPALESLFSNIAKVAGLRPKTLLKRVTTQAFSCEFCEMLKNTYFVEHLGTAASVLDFQSTSLSSSFVTFHSSKWPFFEILFQKPIVRFNRTHLRIEINRSQLE